MPTHVGMNNKRSFTGRQIATMVVAICGALVLLPLGAVAATGSNVNIVDPFHQARKARVDAGGRLTVADSRPVTTALLHKPSLSCGASGSGVAHVVDTSGASSIRLWAYNPGPSQAIVEIYPVLAGQAQGVAPIFSYTMPHSQSSSLNQVIQTPPNKIDVRIYFCSAGFRMAVYGAR